jgi:hypothetical protein
VKYISASSQLGAQRYYIHVEAELLRVFGFVAAEELVFGDAGLFVIFEAKFYCSIAFFLQVGQNIAR